MAAKCPGPSAQGRPNGRSAPRTTATSTLPSPPAGNHSRRPASLLLLLPLCSIRSSSTSIHLPLAALFLTATILSSALITAANGQHSKGSYTKGSLRWSDGSSDADESQLNPCLSKDTCHDCIRAHPRCAWCLQRGYSSERRRRCDYESNLARNNCSDARVYHPEHSVRKVGDDPLSNKTTNQRDAVQLKPQLVKLSLKPNAPYTLKVQFKQAVDYPVDLYYLMDLSKSMEDDKAKLAELGERLSNEMQRLTSNFRLGFGSFVDKIVMPYVSTVPAMLKAPCTKCAAPYGFKNHMPLDTDTAGFTSKVTETQISGNLDAPEGGFDAIMQAVVCKDDIKWRNNSRKLLVFSTDSGFHYAGDGKLGGIVKPNDGQCHLDREGSYTQSTILDYPSISQVNQKVTSNHVNIIFAVTSGQFNIYKQLTPLIEGSSAGVLKNDSSNVVQLVKKEYEKITSTVELKDNARDEFIQLRYYSSCKAGQRREETNLCRGLRVGDLVDFDVEIVVKKCPERREDWNQTFQIYPVGLQDSLTVQLDIICECECEKEWNEERNSPDCSDGHGTLQCGICECNPQRYGRKCECDAKETDQLKDELQCIKGNDTKVCSGRGVCLCGVCVCSQKGDYDRIYGDFCECDNFGCDRADGKICSGPEHGECDCGICKCSPEWSGSACDCKRSQEGCMDPKSGKLCGGKGECVCGECKCEETEEGHYTGAYCEQCLTCKTKCESLKPCVQCQVFNTGELKDEACKGNCTAFKAIEHDQLEVDDSYQVHCVFIDEDDCKFQFTYHYGEDDERIYVNAQRTKDCPAPVNVFAIVIGVIVGIVLVGLAFLLIWKLLTTIHDRREFAKFEKERQMAKWDTGENPIYKQATTTFKNPTYGGKQ